MELLVEDADIITMAPGPASGGPARCLLVRDGRITAVGPAEQVRGAAGACWRVVRRPRPPCCPG